MSLLNRVCPFRILFIFIFMPSPLKLSHNLSCSSDLPSRTSLLKLVFVHWFGHFFHMGALASRTKLTLHHNSSAPYKVTSNIEICESQCLICDAYFVMCLLCETNRKKQAPTWVDKRNAIERHILWLPHQTCRLLCWTRWLSRPPETVRMLFVKCQ